MVGDVAFVFYLNGNPTPALGSRIIEFSCSSQNSLVNLARFATFHVISNRVFSKTSTEILVSTIKNNRFNPASF